MTEWPTVPVETQAHMDDTLGMPYPTPTEAAEPAAEQPETVVVYPVTME